MLRGTRRLKKRYQRTTTQKRHIRTNGQPSIIPTKWMPITVVATSLIGISYSLFGTMTTTATPQLAQAQEDILEPTGVSMRSVIPSFAKVQDSLAAVGYADAENYPQVVVVGIQSSGKSSVLEMIVGEEFVPKGEGTVTKVPLVITLHHIDQNDKWAEFPGTSSKKIRDFSVVKRKILEGNRQFSSEPIRLDIYSPDVVDLRLVDLPGLIHNPTKHQPKNTREMIKDICKNYIKNERTVILAVTEGNTDIQTSEALRFARKYDTEGSRTICVLTKLDLVKDSDINNVLSSLQKLPLRLGYVGVKCRTNQELRQGISILESREIEDNFFKFHNRWDKSGLNTKTGGLATELSNMLEKKVMHFLPEIVDKLRNDLYKLSKELEECGYSPKNEYQRDEILLSEIDNFLNRLIGASTIYEIKVEVAKSIYKTIYDRCTNRLKNFDYSGATSFNEIIEVNDSGNLEVPKFWEGQDDIVYQKWQSQVISLVSELQGLSEEMTYNTIRLLRDQVDDSVKVLSHRPALRDAVKNNTLKHLNQSYTATVKHVEYLINIEQCVSYDSHSLERYILIKEKKKQSGQEERVPQSKGWFWASNEDERIRSGKYGKVWTEAYLDLLTERLAQNIYNSLSVDILDPLRSQLQKNYTVNIFGQLDHDMLLEERSEIVQNRRLLESQVVEIESALNTLEKLISA
eukprot:TRINITY_DN1345_c0_g1_i1.p1 TRINITY_DN1345_c0_g1~~TRINITY_DN1345_c0_g1_i1.p1  ORF type:complete len:687 (+),score=121.86 TRINITY_DN1345_c0_g1_i1:39-2099(+)